MKKRKTKRAKPQSLRGRFLAFDRRLERLGIPPLTAWWRGGIGQWLTAYEKGHVCELWGCVGRGAAKSTALYKLATFFSLFGDFVVPPGETHYAIVLSRLKEEAGKGVGIIDSWLTLLEVEHTVAGDVIELTGKRRGIRIVAASVAAASGWRAYFVGRDERSKWPASGIEDREAEEIDVSSTAMTATHAYAPIVSVGSAWGKWGAFYDAIASGTDGAKVVLGPTPTWVAAPHISEESTRRKERNASKWAREYACEFQESTEESLYPVELIDRARRKEPGDLPPSAGNYFAAAMDPSLGRNSWSLVVVGQHEVKGRPKLSVFVSREWRLPPGQSFDMGMMMHTVATIVKPYCDTIHTDQFHAESLQAIAERMHLGVRLMIDKPPAAKKLERYENLLTLLSDDAIELHEDRQLRADLIAVQRKFTKNSGFAIELPTTANGRHCDYAPSVVLACAWAHKASRRHREYDPGTSAGCFGFCKSPFDGYVALDAMRR